MNLVLLQPVLSAADSHGNLDAIESLTRSAASRIGTEDILLLPEHFTSDDDVNAYLAFLRRIARIAGCTVVGGSHHRRVDGTRVNAGTVVDAKGEELARYAKLRPYFGEQRHISPGDHFGELTVNGKNILVIVCADFWYSDLLLRAAALPDLLLVPSLSVSRKPDPSYSRSLWRHLAVSRAYEFGVYVGISDWAGQSALPQYRTCGVGGFADPTGVDADNFFQPVSADGVSLYPLDFTALEEFRADRRMRGFFWK